MINFEMTTTVKKNIVHKKLAAFDSLIDGTERRILINNVSWREYEKYLEIFAERAGWRLAFDEGKLEFIPPTLNHERFSTTFNDFIRAYCMFYDIDLESGGSTTFHSQLLNKGVEPDECFYIQNAKEVQGKVNLKKPYPVPDIAVEIDIIKESLDKFPIYVALEVRENWVYDAENLSFYKLDSGNYHQIPHSRALLQLLAKELEASLEMSNNKGQTAALKSFR